MNKFDFKIVFSVIFVVLIIFCIIVLTNSIQALIFLKSNSGLPDSFWTHKRAILATIISAVILTLSITMTIVLVLKIIKQYK